MAKPGWLKEKENSAPSVEEMADKCADCSHFGRPVKYARHKGKEKVLVHECAIHSGCLGTRYSLACKDYVPMQV